jgi:hypothetical protein
VAGELGRLNVSVLVSPGNEARGVNEYLDIRNGQEVVGSR